jgi:hypothetical protein
VGDSWILQPEDPWDRPAGGGVLLSHRDHSLLREAASSSTRTQAKVVVTSPIA